MERPALPPRRNGVVVLAHERYEGKKDILVRNSGIKNGDMGISSLDVKGLGRIATVGFNFESEMFFILNILTGTVCYLNFSSEMNFTTNRLEENIKIWKQ